ncbi:MAG TPA: hypothetical protein DC034_08045, partial [Clostridium sp.]|nr:hypothetical protein [Clostridium sp.]
MIGKSGKKIAWLLVIMMVLSSIITPNIAKASDNTRTGSYIQAAAAGLIDESYKIVTTNGVSRGSVFLTFTTDTDLSAVPVTLYANGCSFTIVNAAGVTVTVNNGTSKTITLDLTNENIATLAMPSGDGEGTYAISGAIMGETIDVTVSVSVENPELWLDGNYDIEYPIDPPEINPDMSRVA